MSVLRQYVGLDTLMKSGKFLRMDLDELFAKRPDDPLMQLARQDLDPLSVEELHERVTILEGELTRVKQKIEGAVNFRASADALFKK